MYAESTDKEMIKKNISDFMCKESFKLFLAGAVLLVSSCVDNNYDLVNKDICTDVRIEGNRISVPFGSLNAITLDSIIDVDDVDILEKGADGVYSITIDETISPVKETIDPVKLNVDQQEHSVEIDFENVEIDTVHIDAHPIDPIVFTTPEISISDLNSKLPVLESNAVTAIDNKEIDQFFQLLEANPAFSAELKLDETVGTGVKYVDCDFSYVLPKEVETINSIRLMTPGEQGPSKGTLVEVVVTNSQLLNTLDIFTDFRITFPECFELYTDEYTLSKGKNEIIVKNLQLKGGRNTLRFYIKEIKEIDKNINADGVLEFAKTISYALDYKISGKLNINSNLKKSDLDFNVSFKVPLALEDAKGKTKDIEVGFEPIVMDFGAHFDDLEYIDTIYYIDFDKTRSMLQFESAMDIEWISDFKLKEGHALKIDFPENLFISDEYSQYKGKGKDVVYSAADHAFYVYDLQALSNASWKLALEKFELNVPVDTEKHECDINVEAGIYFVDENKAKTDVLTFAAVELSSMNSTLDGLKGSKRAEFSMNSTDLFIDDAVVHTEVIKSELDTSTDFTINEEVPEEIGRLESIELKNQGVLTFDMSVSGLEELDEVVHLDLYAVMPSFLKLHSVEEQNKGVGLDIKDDTVFINAEINPSRESRLSFALACVGLDFKTEEFGYLGMEPKDSTDGKSYLSYDGNISIVGDAYIDGVDMHSNILEKLDNIVLDINVAVDEMQVKTFHGLYRGDIDEVEESFELDLGDGLDFLKEDGNSITLAEPQFEILIDNSIGVPIFVDMEIFGKDDNGKIIASSLITQRVNVKPAEYNDKTGEIKAVETKLFLTCDSCKVAKVGYDNVQVPGLANLLEKVPNSIDFKIKPVVDMSRTHHIDITDTLTLSGSYAVYIPLKFDNLNIVYNDTITDLMESIGESIDEFTNITLEARMDVTNTIPVALQLSATALDMKDNLMEDIKIEPVSIKAGLGGNIVDSSQESQKIVVVIKSATGDFSKLDKIAFRVEAASDHTTGSDALSAGQGVKISDIILDITGDIETDLSE